MTRRMTPDRLHAALPRSLVLLCAALWIAVGLFGREPYKPDEAYTVGLVKSIVDTGDWVVPRLVGEPFMEKPPLFFGVAALFARLLPWLPLHEAARCAVVLFVAIGLLAVAACARAVHGTGSGRLAVLLTLSTVGAVVRLHQLITDTALFAGVAIALLGLVRAPQRPTLGGALLGFGFGVAFFAKGLLGPGLIACTAVALLALPSWRQPRIAGSYALAALVAALMLACWLVPLALRAPDQLRVWFFDNNLGRFFGSNTLGPKKDLLFYARLLPWYALPCWPLALWGWLRATQGGKSDETRWLGAVPLAFLLVGIAVLSLASDGRELYALVLVPAFAVAASGGLQRIPVEAERRIAIGVAALMLVLSAALLGAWGVAMLSPQMTATLPAVAALAAMVAPSPAAMAVYGAVALTLLLMLGSLRRPTRGTLPLAGAAGMALLWASLMLPWGNYLDTLKGYRGPSLALGRHLPATGCVASAGLGEGERALLDYYIGLRTRRVETMPSAAECAALLVQSLPDSTASVDASWRLRWEGARGGLRFDSSVLRLYVR